MITVQGPEADHLLSHIAIASTFIFLDMENVHDLVILEATIEYPGRGTIRICTNSGNSHHHGPMERRVITILMLAQSWMTLSVHWTCTSPNLEPAYALPSSHPSTILPPTAARSHLSSLHMQPMNAKFPVQNSLETKISDHSGQHVVVRSLR